MNHESSHSTGGNGNAETARLIEELSEKCEQNATLIQELTAHITNVLRATNETLADQQSQIDELRRSQTVSDNNPPH